MAQFTNSELKHEIVTYISKIKAIEVSVKEMLIGRQARIISDYNGQLYGHSKPSLRGKVITIKYASIDSLGCSVWDGDWNNRAYIGIDEIEFL